MIRFQNSPYWFIVLLFVKNIPMAAKSVTHASKFKFLKIDLKW